ncbi:MAG: LysR family transcriptional regulator [Hyphomicrobiaceae bacterium]|nr:MAG: LysR family transcriptional regulator [Hyphomicrobiaceae bacterium]
MKVLDWNSARAFCATADTGSLSAAARKLGLTQPTLSRQVAALEVGLGVTLFERIGKRLVLTNTGRGLLEHVRTMAAAADAMALAAEGKSQAVTGRVVISATDAFSTYILPEIIEHIRELAPQMTLVVVATDSISDLRRREADIAIRHVRPTEPELIGRLVVGMTAHFYAADTWVAKYGLPRTVADIGKVDLLGFEPVERFVEHLSKAGIAVTASQCRIVSASAVALWEMTRRGLGVGMMLRECAERMPGLVRLLPDLPGTPVPVWLVTHRELHTSKRVRLVFDAIAAKLSHCSTGSTAGGPSRKIYKTST